MGENKKGQNMLYLVLGVATLVVAIIGATFAYFSAAASANGDNISGQTENNLAGALTLNVKRVVFTETGANSDYLVPTDLEADVDGINAAVSKKCVGQGYTGCHIYRITASSTQTLKNASVKLTSLTTTAVDSASWKYAIYTNTGDTLDDEGEVTAVNYNADSVVTTGDFKTFKTTYMDTEPATAFDMHSNGSLTADEPVYYYLVIYLANKDNTVQNPSGDGADTNPDNGTGTYNGTVTMDVLGGKVVASFSASA